MVEKVESSDLQRRGLHGTSVAKIFLFGLITSLIVIGYLFLQYNRLEEDRANVQSAWRELAAKLQDRYQAAERQLQRSDSEQEIAQTAKLSESVKQFVGTSQMPAQLQSAQTIEGLLAQLENLKFENDPGLKDAAQRYNASVDQAMKHRQGIAARIVLNIIRLPSLGRIELAE